MSHHYHDHKKDALIGALIAAAAGGVAYTFLASKSGDNMKKNVTHKYEEIRNNLEEFLGSLEKNATKHLNKKTNEWSSEAKNSLDYIKKQISSLHLSEHKELGIGILSGAILGLALGAGATWLNRDRVSQHGEGVLNNIGHHLSSLKPILSEIQQFVGEPQTKCDSINSHPNNSKLNDILECAAVGLKLWNNLQRKS